ncbi:MAG: hypothetical protein MO846_02075 [Candidatus Devosia symbiotica]|nr:hypothetical protein [Candidatus Devosia symbiotica]
MCLCYILSAHMLKPPTWPIPPAQTGMKVDPLIVGQAFRDDTTIMVDFVDPEFSSILAQYPAVLLER